MMNRKNSLKKNVQMFWLIKVRKNIRTGLATMLLLLLCSFSATAAEPTITILLEAVARQPEVEASALSVKATDMKLEQTHAQFYPKISAFARYSKFNSPTNFRPMPPTEVDIAAGDSIPFSKEIFRYGLNAEMPLFIKSLYSLSDKVKQLQKVSRARHKLQLVTRQAAVVVLDASLAFNLHLDKAIGSRFDSLRKTRDDLQLAVNNGRVPESELLKVETILNDLQKQQNDLERQTISLTGQLVQLTGIHLTHAVPISLKRPVADGPFLQQTQQQASVGAAEKELQRAKDQRYPTVMLEGFVSENSGDAYNTHDNIDRSYDYVGVKLSLPLFDRSLHTAITQADIQLRREKQQLSQLQIDLVATAESLRQQLPLVDRSDDLARTNLKNKQQLLDIAKVAFRNGRMTTEEYLRFEAQVLDAEAALYKTHVDRWKIISQQAVLYGDDLTGVVQ
jgi:outer membrane protein TolC